MAEKKGFDYWLYDSPLNSDDFFDYMTNFMHTAEKPINFLLVTSKTPLIEILQEWNPQNFEVIVTGKEEMFTIDIEKTMENKLKKNENPRIIDIKARITKYQNLPVYLIISACSKSDFKKVITKLIQKHYPDISKLFLTNTEIEKIIISLEKNTDNKIIVESYSTKERLFGKKKKVKSNMSYTEEYHSEFFANVARKNNWINSIKFVAKFTKQYNDEVVTDTSFTGVIDRECFFSCTDNFKPFKDIVIPSVIEYAYKRNQYFEVRALKKEKIEKKSNPIVIKFNEELFSDISENKDFVDAFLTLEKFAVSSFHTNPYIQLSLLDYLDGSSYDLWVISEDRVIIYPQISASVASMNRLVNHIFEYVNEGTVEDYEQITI